MEGKRGIPIKDGDVFVLSTNPFRFIYRDAVDFRKIAETTKDRGAEACFARNSVLLFVVATEALINRILETYALSEFPVYIKDKIQDLPLDLKWYMAPLWCTTNEKTPTYDVGSEPFQSFRELVSIRNRYVHPRSLHMPMEFKSARDRIVDYVDKDIPRWPQTKIPKDLNHFGKEASKTANQIVDAMIDQLDRFLEGKVKQQNWWMTEKMEKREKKKE